MRIMYEKIMNRILGSKLKIFFKDFVIDFFFQKNQDKTNTVKKRFVIKISSITEHFVKTNCREYTVKTLIKIPINTNK